MKKTYYSIHKNKKPKKLSSNKLDKKTLNIIAKAFIEVARLAKLWQEKIQKTQPIPNYKKGANATQFFCDEANEVVIDRNGKEKTLKNTSKSIGVVNSEQLTNHISSFSKAIKDTNPKMLVGSAAYNGNGYSQDYNEYIKKLK